MIVILQPGATEEQLARVVERIEELGFRPHVSSGDERTIVGVVGDERPIEEEAFEVLEGVERVVRILHRFKLASRDLYPADRVVQISPGCSVGGRDVVVVAGPCSVESEDQLRATSEAVARGGAHALRGGAFKPRTSPYSFRGHGVEALELLREVGDTLGLAVVTEVVAPADVERVAQYADVLQVGARNMTNYALLASLGEIRKPVLLKRGLGSTVDELLQAAEYILAGGNEGVILCERGIRTFEPSTRFTLDINAVPVLKRLTSLPVFVDPSHAAGKADLVPALAYAAVAAGADGLLVEVHHDPTQAWSDGPQSLTPETFTMMMEQARAVAEAVGRRLP